MGRYDFSLGENNEFAVTLKIKNPKKVYILDLLSNRYDMNWVILKNGTIFIGTINDIEKNESNIRYYGLANKIGDILIIDDYGKNLWNEENENHATVRQIAGKLKKVINGPVEAKDINLLTILQILATESGVDMITGSIEAKVEFHLNSPTIMEVLKALITQLKLDVAILDNGCMYVDTPQRTARFGSRILYYGLPE